jgi:hypothetical protein
VSIKFIEVFGIFPFIRPLVFYNVDGGMNIVVKIVDLIKVDT